MDDIDYSKTYRVLLNHISPGKRPGMRVLRSLGSYLPYCKVLGFGYYDHYKLWYLMVYDPTFPSNIYATASNMSWEQATGANIHQLISRQPPDPNNPNFTG